MAFHQKKYSDTHMKNLTTETLKPDDSTLATSVFFIQSLQTKTTSAKPVAKSRWRVLQ